MTAVSARLVRLLNMVPYFQANPTITYAEAATDLGVSVKQLRDDLNQLWMCGLPGYGPGDLIDFEFSGDTIEVTFSAGIDHPLRLTSPAWSIRKPPAARSPRSNRPREWSDTARECPSRRSTSPRRSKATPPPRCGPPCGTAGHWRSSTTRRRSEE